MKKFALLAFIAIITALVIVVPGKSRKIDHVFLITIDTLRADHLSCYGYPRKTSPFLDQLAESSIQFMNAYAHSATTAPSHASMFTSLYPIGHQVNKNWVKLDDSNVTLAEMLKENGFRTQAFTSVELFETCNLYQGFDYYDEPVDARIKWGKKYRQSELTFNEVKKFFDSKDPGGKTFTWIHLFDPHRPYYPPSRLKETIKKMGDGEEMIDYWLKVQQKDIRAYKGEIFSHREKSDFFKTNKNYYQEWKTEYVMLDQINMYDAEIMYVDSVIKKIFEFFKNSGYLENSLWIITGDHGEGLGNHKWLAHSKNLYNDSIKIPLIIKIGNENKGKRIEHFVEQADLAPTIASILDIEFEQTDPIPGESLLIFLNGKGKRYKKKYSFSQREFYKKRKKQGEIPKYVKFEHGQKYSVQDNSYKYIYRTEYKDELYDLTKDPNEVRNLLDELPEIAAKLKGELLRILSNNKSKKRKVKKGTDEQINKIKSLGYIE